MGLPLSPGATSLFAYWSQGWGDSWVSLSPVPLRPLREVLPLSIPLSPFVLSANV